MVTNLSKQIHSIGQKIALPYIVFFELVLIARMVSGYSMLPSKIDSIFSMIIMLLSAIVFLGHFLPMFLERKKIKLEYWLILFIGILVITTLVNHSFAFSENIRLIIWQCIFFFCVFEIGRDNNKRVFDIFESILLVLWTILVIVALYLLFARISFSMPVKSLYYGMRIGFYENRLYGVFVDPNYACTISLVSIVVAVRKMILSNKNWAKVVYAIAIFLQFSYVALSGSRSGVIQLAAVTFFGTFFLIWFYQTKKQQAVLSKTVQAVLISAICSAVLYGGVTLFKTTYITAANSIQISRPAAVDTFKAEKSKETLDDKKLTTERPDVVENTDISNSRFALWKSAVDIMKLDPLFGASPKGFVSVARAEIPDTHIAKTAQTPHSAIFYLLAATGITGTLVFVIFLIIKMVQSLRILFAAKKNDYIQFLIDNQVVLIILVSGLLITEIILTRRFGTFIFWLYLGRLQHSFDQPNKLEKRSAE